MIYTITLNPAVDRLLFIESELMKRKTNRIERVAFDLGGKGLHCSYVLSALAIPNKALGICGEKNQDKLFAILKDKKIDAECIEVPGGWSRECYILLEKGISGSTMLTEKGFTVTEQVKSNFLRLIQKNVKIGDTVLIAGSLPQNYKIHDLEKIIRLLKKKDCFIACDLSGDALKKAVELEVDFIKPNEFELLELVSGTGDLTDHLKELAKKVKIIVASQGGNGSYCSYDGVIYKVIPPNVTERNDTGAGDNFTGAFIGGFYLNHPIEECLTFASACAASKVQHADSTTFDPAEAEGMLDQVTITKIITEGESSKKCYTNQKENA